MLKKIELIGEQKKVLTLSHQGPIQIKGAAGSGKTTVAVYRACHLMDTYTDLFEAGRVAIFTFNKSLSGYLTDLTTDLNGRNYAGMTVINFHKWAYHFLENNGIPMRGHVFDEGQAKYLLNSIIQNMKLSKPGLERILSKSIEFYIDEIAWLKGKIISTLEEYNETKRSGRGTSDRVTANDKVVLWEVYSLYNQELASRGKYDFEDFALQCLKVLNKPTFKPLFTHIVIDEAQDLSKAQVSVLSGIISPITNSITIIADAAQRIYKSGFVWREVGINVTGGRTIEFKKNYRNTEPIARAALSLLEHDGDTEDFTQVEIGNRQGTKPKLVSANLQTGEYNYILTIIKEIREKNNGESICLIHRTNLGLTPWNIMLNQNGFRTLNISKSGKINFESDCICVATMQSVKGLEFDHVFICSLIDENLPIGAGFSEPNDDLHISTERRLLYTCMTRAIQTLTLSYCGTPSRYLEEITDVLVDKVKI
ncbi:AAA family ATPase [Enterobacteriaceae bacterium RIT711]|nr:AAA family ATPase [Enterobacteriaceae bacterium RIT711]